jgi:fructokinase
MSPPAFLVCGEALFDVYCEASTAAGLHCDARAAGSPFNVAVGLARLGHRVRFCGGLSGGTLGRRLREHLEAEGVDTSLSPTLDTATTLSLVETDGAGTPRYTFYGERGADRLMEAVPSLPADVGVIQIGSYPLVVEPVASALRDMVARERGRRVISCDVNLRLGVEPSLERWREAVDVIERHATLMKASEEDLALLAPDAAPEDIARRWIEAGCALVVVTRGAQGATAWSERATAHVDAQRVDVVDTVGAGDAFQAAWLAWLAEQHGLDERRLRGLDAVALRDGLAFASRAAALVCTRRGADPCRRSEL